MVMIARQKSESSIPRSQECLHVRIRGLADLGRDRGTPCNASLLEAQRRYVVSLLAAYDERSTPGRMPWSNE